MPPLRSIALAVALGATASAAIAAPARQAKPKPKPTVSADVYGGYSYTHAGEASLNGWAVSGSYPLGALAGRLSVVGDLAGHYGSFAGADLAQLALMGGVRHTWVSRARRHGLSPFVEALLGAVRTRTRYGDLSDSHTDPGLAFGGGIDYGLSARWSARGLFHLRFVHGEGVTDTDPRFSVGVACHLR